MRLPEERHACCGRSRAPLVHDDGIGTEDALRLHSEIGYPAIGQCPPGIEAQLAAGTLE
jgi:hypothetical protein